MFLHTSTEEFNNYIILLDLQELSNYVPLSVCIIIKEKFIQDIKLAIIKNSEELINISINRISSIDITNIHDYNKLKDITQKFTSITEKLWYKYFKLVNITK